MSARSEAVQEKIFREDSGHLFAVLDGASVPGLQQRLIDDEPEHICLYRGTLEPDMAEVAPYLVRLDRDSAFTEWVIERGWGNHWGIFAETTADLRALRQHFRAFVTVHDAGGTPMLFRFYDPRVLGPFLANCSKQDLQNLFGPVAAYVAEDQGGATIVRYRLKNGSLAKQPEPLPQQKT